jgi:hypothetical protein
MIISRNIHKSVSCIFFYSNIGPVRGFHASIKLLVNSNSSSVNNSPSPTESEQNNAALNDPHRYGNEDMPVDSISKEWVHNHILHAAGRKNASEDIDFKTEMDERIAALELRVQEECIEPNIPSSSSSSNGSESDVSETQPFETVMNLDSGSKKRKLDSEIDYPSRASSDEPSGVSEDQPETKRIKQDSSDITGDSDMPDIFESGGE